MFSKDLNTFTLTMPGYPDRIIKLNKVTGINLDNLPLDDTIILTYKDQSEDEIVNHSPFFWEWESFKTILRSIIEAKRKEGKI